MKKVKLWNLWDWKSINGFIIVAIFLCGGFFILNHIPDWVRNSTNEAMTETTDGKFVKAEYIKRFSEGRLGNREVVTGMLIEYTYCINGKVYNSQDKIPNSTENQLFFNALSKEPSKTLKIIYNPNNPVQSQINISSE